MHRIKISQFEGPLELLLQMVENEKLSIVEVSLAEVAEQYISYLDKIEIKNPEQLADFLVVAAKLLYIKSKILLPQLFLGDDEDNELEEQLRIYKKFYEASKLLEKIWNDKKYAYGRPLNSKCLNYFFVPAKSLNSGLLGKIFADILSHIEPVLKIPKKSLVKIISIKQKIGEIKILLEKNQLAGFGDLLAGARNRQEIIVSFLSLLELVKQRHIFLEQNIMFGEIEIKKMTTVNINV